MKKRILSLLTMVCMGMMLLSVNIITAAATEYWEYLNYYVESNGEITITDCESDATEVVIPEEIDGKKVTKISGDAFRHKRYLISITIPDTIKSIGSEAFYSCSNLSNVYISDLKTYLSIDFADYSSLPTSYGHNLYLNNELLTDVVIPNGPEKIPTYAFYENKNIASVVIPDSVTSIGNYAFYDCGSLTSVVIPDSVTSIGNSAFYDCGSLASVVIPDSVTSIGDSAFYGCGSLASVVIPDSVTSIGDYTFNYCRGLKSVVIPKSVTKIGRDAFSRTNLSMAFYLGDEEDWEEIYFASNNDDIKNATIIYNATKKIYKFETNCESELADISDYAVMSSPTVKNGDKTLLGWYNNKSFTGSPVTFPYCGEATTLYASWTDRTGASFDDAFYVKANEEYSVNISESGQVVYYEFTPKITGEYRFYSKGSLDTYAYLYDSEQYRLTSNDDGGEGNNFRIVYDLTAGETYYIAVKLYSVTGSFTLVTETDCIEGVKTVCVTANSGEKIFISIPSYLPEDASVILACYKGDMLVDVQIAPNKNETLYFIVKKDFDSAKVMVWDSLSSMHPACEAENIEKSE